MEKSIYGVHRTHCCVAHGCKYDEEDCPVVTKEIKQDYICQDCDDEGIYKVEDIFKVYPHLLPYDKQLRHHKFIVIYMLEKNQSAFKTALEEYTSKNALTIEDYEVEYSQKVSFTLVGIMSNIEKFLQEFAPEWKVIEMGVSSFARIMELTEKEAEEWYRLIRDYQNLVISKSYFEEKLVTKARQIKDIEKLTYLKSHFQSSMKEYIENMINHLKGEKDDMTKWLERQEEKTKLLNYLESKRNKENIDVDLIINYIKGE